MKNVFHNKSLRTGAVQIHVEPSPITLIIINNDAKSEKDWVKIKFCRDPTSEKSDLYEFKMDLFDNVDLEYLLLFVRNFQITLEVLGVIAASAKIKYLCTLLSGGELHQLYMLYVEVGSTTRTYSNHTVLGFCA